MERSRTCLLAILLGFLMGCNASGTAAPPTSTVQVGPPKISISGANVYDSINPTINFSISDFSSGIESVTFQLDPTGSPWAVEQQKLPPNPTCKLVNNVCASSLSFSNLYATAHTLVLTVTDNSGLQANATYHFSISLPQATQISAATTVATTNVNCVGTGGSSTGITPFYWEIGNAGSGTTPIASGSVTLGGETAVTRSTLFEVDSASKMISGAYFLTQPGVPAWSDSVSPATQAFLHFASGYTHFQDDSCSVRNLSTATNNIASNSDTVLDCYTSCCIVNNSNSVLTDAINGGHLCGNLINHSNASSMIASLEASGVISASDATKGPNVTCNDDYVSATAGSFYYSGGHLQRYAVAADETDAPNPGDGFSNYGYDLASDIGAPSASGSSALAGQFLNSFGLSSLASDFKFAFPQIAGGDYTTAAAYATILQNILSGSLSNYLTYLGKDPVCAFTQANADSAGYSGVKEDSCSDPSGYAIYSPITARLFHYSYTDWVEDDPTVGDGALSSPGKDGEYPWIDASKTYYGLIHRSNSSGTTFDGHSPVGQGYESLLCGSLIRQAFFTGVVPPNVQAH